MKIKVNEASDAALEWAVATCEGRTIVITGKDGVWLDSLKDLGCFVNGSDVYKAEYLTNWLHGGLLAEREEISIDFREDETLARKWDPVTLDFITARAGKRQGLLAAMRCFILFKMGAEIEVPDELVCDRIRKKAP